MWRVVLFLQASSSDLPDNRALRDEPPVQNVDGVRVVLFDGDIPQPNHSVNDVPWKNLFDETYSMDVRAELKRQKKDATIFLMDKLLAETAQEEPIFLMMATYVRQKDEEQSPWVAPGAPSQVIQIQRINPDNEFTKPKSSAAILHAPIMTEDDVVEPEQFRLSGFGRLDDDDFGPIEPSRLDVEKEELKSVEVYVGWTRIARLEVLDRLSGQQNSLRRQRRKREEEKEEQSAFQYDVVFYGPGGELVPTRNATETTNVARNVQEQYPPTAGRPPE